MAEPASTLLAGIEPLLEHYDGFLVDQFGVLLDGARAWPAAIEALRHLRAAGRRVIVLSNSGKRAAANVARLAGLGIPPMLYEGLLTSGEVAWRGLRDRDAPPFDRLGRRCVLFSRNGDRSAVEGLDLELATTPSDAEFGFLSGIDQDDASRAGLDAALDALRASGRPLLCTNPDLVTLDGDRRLEGPGSFARSFAERGGSVYWVGKPHPAIFAAALAEIGLPAGRVAMVGDSLHHDIAGALPFGIAGVLVTEGVHADAFAGPWDRVAIEGRIRELVGQVRAHPRWIVRRFALAA